MTPRLLLDTHVVVRWVIEPRKLSRDQRRTLESAAARREIMALSAVSLLEIAALEESGRVRVNIHEIFDVLQSQPMFQILPITFEIAEESAALTALRDPADRAIVATALVHRLRLITSDQRIIDSSLVPVVE
ncbi:MAG TPA: type II toxin-antitoxin system VapC family toxin [Bryobacteraceae bacterium]|nr:type II toxin-antitoxin system VapC family toxin [Bryobacteraceae bacterium]